MAKAVKTLTMGVTLYDVVGAKIQTITTKIQVPYDYGSATWQPFYTWDDDGDDNRAENVQHREHPEGTEN